MHVPYKMAQRPVLLIGKRSIAGIMEAWAVLSEKIGPFIHKKSLFVIVANPEAWW